MTTCSRNPVLYSALSATALAISASFAQPTMAQQGKDAKALPEIKVKAKALPDQNPNGNPDAPYKAETVDSVKFSRPIAETPKSITVITKESIEDAGNAKLSEVLKAQPGITIGTGEGGNAFGDRFIIRGFEARNDVFTDGLRDPGVISRETFAIEQVEVSKGPSSSFAGRGTTGGAVNLVSKKPGYVDFTKAEISAGTNSKQRYTLDFNKNLDNGVAVRLNALYAERDVPARGLANENHQGLAIAVEDAVSAYLRLGFDFYHFEAKDMPDGGVPWDSLTGAPVPGRLYYGQNGRDFLNTGADIGTFTVNYDMADGSTIENKTRFGRTTNQYFVTIPGLSPRGSGLATPGVFVAASSQNRNQNNVYFGNQTNWSKDVHWGDLKHTVVLGAELSREEVENLPYSDALRSPNAGDPLNPNNEAWLQQGGTYSPNDARFSKIKLDTWSVYALDTATLNHQWEVFGGLRYDTFDYSIYSGPTDYQSGTSVNSKQGFLNGHAGVTYSPWNNGNVYLSYSTSTNPSGEQLDAGSNCAYGGICGKGDTKPEQNRSLELGTKWQLMNKRLLLTSAIFNTTKSNVYQQQGQGGPVSQIGELQVLGFEAGAVGKLTDRLSVSSGLAVLNSKITDSINPAEVGQPFPNVAKKSATVQTRYEITPKLALGGTLTYTGKISGGTPNGPVTNNSIPGNTRLDLMAQYTLDKHKSLRLNIQNVTDKTYYDALYRSNAPFVYVGEGRSATLTLVLNY